MVGAAQLLPADFISLGDLREGKEDQVDIFEDEAAGEVSLAGSGCGSAR